MKPPLRWLLHLYPRMWRERYGHELEALFVDTGNSWRQLPDILIEALKMRIAVTNWKLIISCGLAGLIVAAAVSLRTPDRYVSRAVAEVVLPPDAPPGDMTNWIVVMNRVLSRTSLSTVIQRPDLDLYRKERSTEPLEDVIENMKTRDIRIELQARPRGNRQVVAVSFQASAPDTATAVVQHLLTSMAEENLRLAKTQVPMGFAVVDPPSTPARPSGPNRLVMGLEGVVAGLAIGGLIAWWRSRRKSPPTGPPSAPGSGSPLPARGLLYRIRRYPARALTTAGLMLLAGFALSATPDVVTLPLPYVSHAVVSFPTPDGLRQTLENRVTLESGLLETPNPNGGAWYRLDITPAGTKVLLVSVRYSNRFKAQQLLRSLINRLPAGVDVIDLPSLPVTNPVAGCGPYLMLSGVLLLLLTSCLLLFRPRNMPELQLT